jgi:hypothetical protein
MIFGAGPQLVVTDNPVCETSIPERRGCARVVPITKDLLAVGGDPVVVEAILEWSIVHINLFLAGWSRRMTYPGDRLALELLKSTFKGECLRDVPGEYVEQARLPYFGTAEMLGQSYRNHKAGLGATEITTRTGYKFVMGH